jgi:hypothetical protein
MKPGPRRCNQGCTSASMFHQTAALQGSRRLRRLRGASKHHTALVGMSLQSAFPACTKSFRIWRSQRRRSVHSSILRRGWPCRYLWHHWQERQRHRTVWENTLSLPHLLHAHRCTTCKLMHRPFYKQYHSAVCHSHTCTNSGDSCLISMYILYNICRSG